MAVGREIAVMMLDVPSSLYHLLLHRHLQLMEEYLSHQLIEEKWKSLYIILPSRLDDLSRGREFETVTEL